MFRKKEISDLILDEPIRINGKPTCLRECRDTALDIRDVNWATTVEAGLAYTVVYLIDRLMIAEMTARQVSR